MAQPSPVRLVRSQKEADHANDEAYAEEELIIDVNELIVELFCWEEVIMEMEGWVACPGSWALASSGGRARGRTSCVGTAPSF